MLLCEHKCPNPRCNYYVLIFDMAKLLPVYTWCPKCHVRKLVDFKRISV